MNKLFKDPEKMLSSDLFEKHMDNYEKNIKRTFTVVMALWILYVIAAIAFFGGVIYVAWHFISKFW